MIQAFLDFLQSFLPDSWFADVHSQYDELTNEDIAQSVHEASVFFNMDDPIAIKEGWTTGVFTNMDLTPQDDVLIFSRNQLLDMGITDKEGFDLIMTHEGAHRMLQSMQDETGFNSHQEELCCDYMAGVRAGLNEMDFSKMQASLIDSKENETHPKGETRVAAIEAGVKFANDYKDKHGKAPTFSDCLDFFEHNVLDYDTEELIAKVKQVTLTPEVEEDNFKAYKVCATRHGCTGATNCDYSLGAPIGR